MGKYGWLVGGLLAGWAIQQHLWSYPTLPPLPAPMPKRSREQATASLAQMDAAEVKDVLDVCRTKVWAQQTKAPTCIVLLHGYTNCPQQYERFGRELHADGHAVVAARLPYHGYMNRRPDNLGDMSVTDLAAFLAGVIDAAHGLGERVTLLGFSFGGVLAGWAAQRRPDIDHAVLVSPSLGIDAVQPWLRPVYARLLPILPDRFIWWDPSRQMEKLGPKHGYVGYSTRGIGMMLGLGGGLLKAARQSGPLAKRVSVVVNPHDDVIDNDSARALAEAWQRHGDAARLVHFSAHFNFIHDLMDPQQPGQQVDNVYPILRDMLLTAP